MYGSLEFLFNLGFEFAGEWMVDGGQPKLILNKYREIKNALYAFITEDDVMYIGKTARTLHERMNGYKKPGPTQKTNIKNNKNILELIKKGIPVRILVLVENEDLKYRGVPIDIASGIEDNLIAMIKPRWNEIGKG